MLFALKLLEYNIEQSGYFNKFVPQQKQEDYVTKI